MRPSFQKGLYALQVRCQRTTYSRGVFHPKRSEVNGRVAVRQSWNLHLGSKESGWMVEHEDELTKHDFAEERFLEQSRNDVFIIFLLFLFQMCVLEWFEYGKRVIVVRRHVQRTLETAYSSCWRIPNLQCTISCSESGAWLFEGFVGKRHYVNNHGAFERLASQNAGKLMVLTVPPVNCSCLAQANTKEVSEILKWLGCHVFQLQHGFLV